VGFLNADDRYVVPDAVSSVVAAFDADPTADLVYGRYRFIDEQGRPSPRRAFTGRPFRLASLERYNCVPPHATFVRKSAVTEGLWLDPQYQFAGDWDWALRLAKAGRRFVFLDRVLSEFRLHRASKTSVLGFGAKLKEWRRICRSHGISLPRMLWYESIWIPLRRRLGLAA
jgi:GT2 family glycosyltransferase